jgi:hypothetical protein
MYIRLHIIVQTTPYKVPVVLVRFLSVLKFPNRFSKKFSNVDYHFNPFCEGRFVPRGRTDRLLTVTFHKFANAPKNTLFQGHRKFCDFKFHFEFTFTSFFTKATSRGTATDSWLFATTGEFWVPDLACRTLRGLQSIPHSSISALFCSY